MTELSAPQKIVVGLGEILWDVFPEAARLGGAPANFAVMAGRLGDRAVLASRLGNDARGEAALGVLRKLPVETGFLQKDAEYATGSVTVSIANGEPEYVIHEPVAWDRLELTPEWRELARSADAVCFGTLAQRSQIARTAIQGFLDAARSECVRVFDANLRSPFWSNDVLRQSLARATILKLNAAELPQVLLGAGACPYPTSMEDEGEVLRGVRRLLDRCPVQLICVTMGARGSLLVSREQWHRHPGLASTLRDTVGAGDAFTAALTHYYLQHAPLPVLNEAGNRWGAWMASQSGGMPDLPTETVELINAEVSSRRASWSAEHEFAEERIRK